MYLIQNLKLPISHSEEDLEKEISKKIKVNIDDIIKFQVKRKSIDARSKTSVCFVYSVAVVVREGVSEKIEIDNKNIQKYIPYTYKLSDKRKTLNTRPIIIGSGPAGLFSALLLAEAGTCPIILEQGKDVEARTVDIKNFFSTGKLNESSNIQFGEGGAGTFSDGKLSTLINDKRTQKVFDVFVEAGAPSEILYNAKPHIGTDKLKIVVKNIREKIIALGGEIKFNTKITDVEVAKEKVVAVISETGERFQADVVILALGASARDTFEVLFKKGVYMQSKAFSIGVRIEHPQIMINKSQYRKFFNDPRLGSAEYKLVHHAKSGRSVYSFCVCPGGTVIASSSENEGIVTNGMSEFARDNENANSAIVVGVKPEDFGSDEPLAGIEFQRKWERLAFKAGGGDFIAPAQLVGDFLKGKKSTALRSVMPSYSPGISLGDLNECLPEFVIETIKEGFGSFDNKIRGFAFSDAVLTGVETRTSSPVRILRDEKYCSNIKGIFPIGEGAGYAGGIVSAALDGIKAVEAILEVGKL